MVAPDSLARKQRGATIMLACEARRSGGSGGREGCERQGISAGRCAFFTLCLLLLTFNEVRAGDLWQTSPVTAGNSPLLAAVGKRLGAETAVEQRFVQEKRLRILKRPLRTEGLMLYRAGRGVCWHTERPVISTLVLGEDELRQVSDERELILKAEQQPALFSFSRLFFSALSGQVNDLTDQFELRAAGTEERWQLGLSPRAEALRRFIGRMELRGGERVERVLMTDRDGDLTEISFTPLEKEADEAGLIAELERRCFGQ